MKNRILIILLLFANIAFAQDTIFVKVMGTGDGSSWTNATNLENAMTLANTDYGFLRPDIWVQEGIYFPSTTVRVPAYVNVFGGFLGHETSLSQRNFAKNRTIIDGQKSFGVVHLGNSAVLDGFAIINGHAYVQPDTVGGGVFMEDHSRVENCYILDNTASGYGGGIYAVGNGLVYNVLFSGNAAKIDGLAIYGTTLDVRNVTVSGNRRDGDVITVDSNYCNIATPAWVLVGTQNFSTNSVWLTDTLLWSDAVTVNTCRKTAFDGGELGPPTFFHSDCRSNPDFKGDLFSWCAVKKFGNFLCPNSWRVPTRQEFINLDLILGGTGENQSDIDLGNSYLNDWGGIFGGFCDSVGTLENQGSWARYWSQTRVTTTSGFPLRFGTGGTVILQSNLNKNLGLTLRCVRDCPRIILEIADETTRHQTVCQNEPIETVTHFLGGAVANATLSWSGGIFPNGITGDASSFSGIPTTAGTYAWTITATSSVDGCPPKISTGTITVNALPTKVTVTEISHCDSTILTASNETFGNCRIFWQNTTNNGKDTTIASTLQIVKEDGTYYFRARSLEGCWGEQGSRTVVINTAPVFYLHPDTTTRIVVQGGIFPKLTYYVSGVESDVRWYSNTTNSNIGGTLIPNLFYIPSSEVVGTLYYYFEASNSCGNTASNVSGAHIVEPITIDANGCNNATPGWGESLGTVSFATGSIWVVGNQIWSDAVQATSCNKVTFNSGIISNLNSDCRSNPGYPGDLFSWCAVARFQNQLCPGNWRVPTRQNFIDLDIALGGTGENMQHNTSYMSRYLSVWGGAFGGIGYSGHLEMQEQGGIYWSISQVAISHANVLIFKHPNFMVSYGPQYTQQKNNNASSLRCVRDTVCPVGTLLDVSMAGGNVLNGLKDRSPHNRAHLGDAAGLTVFDNTSLASVANSNKQGIYWDIPEMLTACKLTLEYEIHPTSYGNQHGLTLSFVYSADIYMTAGMLTRGGFDGGFTAFGWLCQKQPYERLPLGKWSKIKVELDFVASTIKTYINDVLWHSANATIPRTRQILIGASVLNHDVAVNCGLRNIKITQN